MPEETLDEQTNDVVIDLSGMFRFLFARFWIILICLVIGAGAGFAIATATYVPTFQSDATFIVDIASGEDISGSTAITYAKSVVANLVKVAQTKRFYTMVSDEIKEGGLYGGEYGVEAENIEGYLSFTTDTTTTSITVSVVTQEAWLSYVIANVISDNFNDYVMENYSVVASMKVALSCIDDPSLPESPVSSSDKVKYAAIGGLGLAFVYCLVMIIIYLADNRVRNEEMIEEQFGVSLLGSMPVVVNPDEKGAVGKKIVDLRGKSRKKGKKQRSDILVNDKSPFMIQEALNMIKANISVAVPRKREGGAVKIFFTSALPDTGKSTLTSNVAVAMAKDARVLLVDADLRKGRIRRFFRLSHAKGLSEVLSGQADAGECLIPIDVTRVGEENCLADSFESANLHVLLSGKVAPNPYELLSSAEMKALLQEFGQYYDYIFIDTPPVEVVSDALALVPETDGCIVILKHMFSTKKETNKMLATLRFADCKIIGTILNEFTGEYGEYGYGRKYSYKYAYKYGYKYSYHYNNAYETETLKREKTKK